MGYPYLDRNLAEIRRRLSDACRAAGRDASDVTVLAAVKGADVGEINDLHRRLGVSVIGENRVQQLLARYEQLDREGLRIHFIGSLQTNKVRYIADKVDMIESLDSERLAREIERRVAACGREMDVLIEINIGREPAKGGVLPEDARAFAGLITGGAFPHLRLRGFMTMAPMGTEDAYRRRFAEMRRLAEGIFQTLPEAARRERMVLSMGMSDSYEAAAAEGATIVRVGRALFARPAPDGS